MTMNVPEQFVINMLHATTLLVHLDVNVMKVSLVMDGIVRVKINIRGTLKNIVKYKRP